VLLPDERPVVLFLRSPRRDFFPLAARLVLGRACAAHGWEFPHDLTNPACAAAVWDILWLASPGVVPDADLATVAQQTPGGLARSGSLVVPVRWRFDGARDEIRLLWDPIRLDTISARFDGPAQSG